MGLKGNKELDKLIASSISESNLMGLTEERKKMLEMSREDIKAGRLISHEAMDKRNMKWLNEL